MQQLLDGRYEILKPLGSGGFGKTYLARDLRIPGTPSCVVKQLHCVSRDPQDIQLAQQLFQREAESLAKLGHHDQIPRLLAYFTENGEFFLVEDYIEGRSLDTEIQAGQPWPEAAVVELVRGILDVLAFVHSQNVIHRDIKPDNLIRRQSDGKIVLIDFGAIKQLEQAHPGQAHRTGTQIGTAGFMPPEQAQGKPRPNSDIYGIGMVAISAITGQPAMGLPDDPQTGEIVWQHLTPVSPGLAQILNRMVRYHFQQRYQTIAEVQQDLQSLSAHIPAKPLAAQAGTASIPTQVAHPGPHPSSPAQRSPISSQPKQPKGRSWLLGIGLAVVIPVLGGAASLLFHQGSTVLEQRAQEDAAEAAKAKPCAATVNGNIRSERTAYFGNQNILQTGQGKSFEVGAKETRGGWIEIKLSSGRTAWTHLDVVSNESALKACLNQKNMTLQTVSDIAPPLRPKPATPAPRPTPPTAAPETLETPENIESNASESDSSESENPAEPIESMEETATPSNQSPEIEETQPTTLEETESPERTAPGTSSPQDSSSTSNNPTPDESTTSPDSTQ